MQGIIVLIVYALLMVGATKAFTKREDGGESFHVGHIMYFHMNCVEQSRI